MGHRKKIKLPPKIPCSHCLAYQNSKRLLDNGRIRYCSFLKEDIFGDELRASSCSEFKASQFFWCDRCNQRLSISICLHRKEHKMSECRRCKIHAIILEVKKRENGQLAQNSWRKPCSENVCLIKSWRNRDV